MGSFDQKVLADLSPAARTIVGFEKNGAIDVIRPQALFAEVLQDNPRPVRWEQGVAFFRYDGCPGSHPQPGHHLK